MRSSVEVLFFLFGVFVLIMSLFYINTYVTILIGVEPMGPLFEALRIKAITPFILALTSLM